MGSKLGELNVGSRYHLHHLSTLSKTGLRAVSPSNTLSLKVLSVKKKKNAEAEDAWKMGWKSEKGKSNDYEDGKQGC